MKGLVAAYLGMHNYYLDSKINYRLSSMHRLQDSLNGNNSAAKARFCFLYCVFINDLKI